jgi:hypothetical protein
MGHHCCHLDTQVTDKIILFGFASGFPSFCCSFEKGAKIAVLQLLFKMKERADFTQEGTN